MQQCKTSTADARLIAMQNRTPSLSAGLAAGFLAGLAGSAAKAAAEAIYPPRTAGQTPPPIVLVRKVAGHRLGRRFEARAMKCIHYGSGAVVGAGYGWLAEYYPRVTAGTGALFGASLNVVTHETTLPLLGLSDSPLKQKPREQVSEAVTHVVFGVAVELTRRLLRSKLFRKRS
jgi:putative membrane protein